jgi:hypothetical protein
MDRHRVYVRLVWMCTKRGTNTDVHLVNVGLGYTPSTCGTGMDVHRVYVGLVWIVKCISEDAVCVSVRFLKLEYTCTRNKPADIVLCRESVQFRNDTRSLTALVAANVTRKIIHAL